MSSKKKPEFALNIGVSSILFIFVILCLVSFATLSLSSATSDYRLSQRVLNNSQNYYDACNKAEELLASFDDTLKKTYDGGISRAGYYESVGHKKTFSVDLSDYQSLQVEIKILYPDVAGNPFYEITSWKVITTGNLEYDDSLNVFK